MYSSLMFIQSTIRQVCTVLMGQTHGKCIRDLLQMDSRVHCLLWINVPLAHTLTCKRGERFRSTSCTCITIRKLFLLVKGSQLGFETADISLSDTPCPSTPWTRLLHVYLQRQGVWEHSPYTQYCNTRPTLITTYHMAGIFAEAVVVV